MVYTVFYKTSSFAGYCFLDKNSIHPKRRDVFNFEHFKVTLVKFQICSFIVHNFFPKPLPDTTFYHKREEPGKHPDLKIFLESFLSYFT